MITRWRRGAKISPVMSRRVLDLHAVLARALQIFAPEVVTDWLVGHEPFLNDARPIDVLAVRGAIATSPKLGLREFIARRSGLRLRGGRGMSPAGKASGYGSAEVCG
jgi:hypothetical protein